MRRLLAASTRHLSRIFRRPSRDHFVDAGNNTHYWYVGQSPALQDIPCDGSFTYGSGSVSGSLTLGSGVEPPPWLPQVAEEPESWCYCI